jgi:hypothetical protein
MSNIHFLIDEVQEMTNNFVSSMRKEPASRLGLDNRCGSVWVSPDAIVAYKGSGIEYYGGFEYIKGDDRIDLGEYVVYFSTSDRVADALDFLMSFDKETVSE